ncbi:PhnA domain-containing protein [Oceanisphaera arctica]|uniref:PhnA domain protein n=1 Tax=Oceanisphaera arctica TaxID=641510 RepID=A0A2P5TKP3_9GAMM|nr:alkylphosphonate utilization protein [Oceanisphaera arctica]PPL15754.1 PhnA domain protein [Oceanisphaera arctica]
MTIEQQLQQRSDGRCELCGATDQLSLQAVSPKNADRADHCTLLCATCQNDLESPQDHNHWRCLNDSMWSQEPAVQVLAWRTLKKLSTEVWARDLLDMMYLEPKTQQWAEMGQVNEEDDSAPTFDSNGARLQAGDSVTLIKDLDVKGAGFTAKRGTMVRGINLTSNPEHIEGKVNGVQIVLVAKFLKKA